MSEQEYDVAISFKQIVMPSALAKVLADAGMHRAKLTITDQGIIVVPYVAPVGVSRARREITLPKWG